MNANLNIGIFLLLCCPNQPYFQLDARNRCQLASFSSSFLVSSCLMHNGPITVSIYTKGALKNASNMLLSFCLTSYLIKNAVNEPVLPTSFLRS